MMGMMTLVRVLPAEKYDEIIALKQRRSATPTKEANAPEQGHE